MSDRSKDIRNEPNMRRHPDMFATEVIAFTDDTGRITEIEVHGDHAGYEEAPTWMLLFVNEETTYRMSTVEDSSLYEISGLEIYEPTSLTLWDWPDGIDSVTIGKGWHMRCGSATVRGTRRALRSYIYDNWFYGGDDDGFEETLAGMTKVEA